MAKKVRLNPVERFLIWSAGADSKVLAQESCLTERYKYESIGTTVLLTSVMAFFSGGYALFTVFGSISISCALGVAWSCVIFNLDRFFILSANRGKSTSKWQFFAASSLRLSIAVLLSLVVAKPLELRLFEAEINQELKQEEIEKPREERRKQQAEWESSNESKRLNEIEANIQQLIDERKQGTVQRNKLTSEVFEELDGTGGTGQAGQGTAFQVKKDLTDKLDKTINNINQQIQQLQNEKTNLIKRRDFILSPPTFDTKLEKENGSLLARLAALERLSQKDSTIAISNLLVSLLFIVIEISPILVKILSKEGLYESLLKQQEENDVKNQYFHSIKEREIQKIQELKDFELKIENLIIEYLRAKGINQEKIENIGVKNITIADEKFSQETLRFLKLCQGRIEHYEHLINQVVVSEIDESMVKNLNYTHNGANKQSRNHADMLD
ncbi:MAG: DUF4407 domain-containing protein [Nostoc sp. ChiSLP01]|nr:DUF4407 domain-containing protein [Nostoc sp. CmiSLP01]MDZ8284092.1 DUF4407 domain-containing protein [Nostoc sp. ChiSLP01]